MGTRLRLGSVTETGVQLPSRVYLQFVDFVTNLGKLDVQPEVGRLPVCRAEYISVEQIQY